MAVTWNAKEAEETVPLPPLPDCGQRVSIETRVHGEKLWTHMIGFKPGAYVVLEKPPGTDAVDNRVLKDGDSLVIRFFKDGTIYGFRTPVLCTATVPYRLLFVGYPLDVAERSRRSSPRLKCYLPCEGQVGGRAFSRAFIRDFSATGCQLRVPLDAVEPEPEIADDADAEDEPNLRAASASAGDSETSAAPEPDAAAEPPEPAADAESSDDDENRLTLELQLPGEDEIRFVHGDVLEWQTLDRFHQLRVKFDEPQDEIFEQLTLYTTRLG